MRVFKERAMQGAGILLLFGMAACHSPNGLTVPPTPPPKPAGYINCAGHYFSECIGRGGNRSIWYAYWMESPDSSIAELQASYDTTDTDTIYLARDTGAWEFATADFRPVYPPPYISITSDSVIVRWNGVDCSNGYYLKKLH